MKSETIRFLTQEEFKRLLKIIDSKRDKALILIAYNYGLRATEVSLLTKEDIDWERIV